jgi:hypothetical protein
MTDRDLVIYIYGYLKGVLNMNKIPSGKILKLKEVISLQQERNKAKLQAINSNIEIEDESLPDWLDDESLIESEEEYRRDLFKDENNDKYYDENLDLDQQDPDFYC